MVLFSFFSFLLVFIFTVFQVATRQTPKINPTFYNSEFFFPIPYASARTIQRALKHLVEAGLLKTGNYNKSPYDRTLWYALAQEQNDDNQGVEVEELIDNIPSADVPNLSNQKTENVSPIPDRKPDNKLTDNKPNNILSSSANLDSVQNDDELEQVRSIIGYLNIKARKNYRANSDKTRKLIRARLREGYTLSDFGRVIDNKCVDWLYNADMNKYLRPETLFGSKFENYLNQTGEISMKNVSNALDVSEYL